jgi:hypothetical protein
MRQIPVLSPLSTLSQPTAAIMFRGERFPIVKKKFVTYSETAAALDRSNVSEFVITSSVTRESVQTFIDVCQEKSPQFETSQILDLLSLCEDWSVTSLKGYLLDLIETDDDQILTALRYAFQRNYRTEEYEARAHRRFRQILDRDELLEFSVSILRRIVDVGLQDTEFDALYEFLKRCLDRFGSCGSILFQGVSLRHFSVSQVQELLDRRDFIWCYLCESVCDTLSLCMSEMVKHQTRFETEHRELRNLQAEYRRVSSEYESLKRNHTDVFSRLSSFEASVVSLQTFQSSATGRLDLLESEGARKSEVEAKYALKSYVATNYAAKSELQTNYLTKSEAGATYVLKSYVDTNCATKSELQQNYLTKSEAGSNYPLKSYVDANCATKSELQQNYLTKSEGRANYALKSYVDANCATKSDLQKNYLTKSEAASLESRCASKSYVVDLLKRVTGTFIPIPDFPLKGIIHHLTAECGGNVDDRGVVAITADRPCSSSASDAAKNIAI